MTTATEESLTNLFTLDREALEQYAEDAGQPAFRGRQLYRWMYGKGARNFDEMTDLPEAFRSHLAQHAQSYRQPRINPPGQWPNSIARSICKTPPSQRAQAAPW